MIEDDLSIYLAPRGRVPGIGPERGCRPINGIAVYVSPHGSVRYVYYSNSVPLAALQIVTDGKRAIIANVYTVRSVRKRGIAKRLLEYARSEYGTVSHAREEMMSDDAKAWRGRVG